MTTQRLELGFNAETADDAERQAREWVAAEPNVACRPGVARDRRGGAAMSRQMAHPDPMTWAMLQEAGRQAHAHVDSEPWTLGEWWDSSSWGERLVPVLIAVYVIAFLWLVLS